MPNLLNFFESNGSFLSNNHTPLIAHTADDILTTYTGLYGDRQGMPISNSFRPTTATGRTAASTRPTRQLVRVLDRPALRHGEQAERAADTNPNMVYSPVPPATAATPVTPNTTTPAPWVPYTRAGCNVGDVATANAELENTGVDIPKVFGANSPEDAQLTADTDSFKDQETADYVGVAVHCAKGAAFCADATATKFGQTTADASPPRPTCCPTSRAATTATRRCSATSTWHRSSARAPITSPATATRSPTPRATSST